MGDSKTSWLVWAVDYHIVFGYHLSGKKCSHSQQRHRRASLLDDLATLHQPRLPLEQPTAPSPEPQGCQHYWSMPAFLLLRPLHASTHTVICPRIRRAFYGGVLNLDIRNAGHRRTGKVPQLSTRTDTLGWPLDDPPALYTWPPHNHQNPSKVADNCEILIVLKALFWNAKQQALWVLGGELRVCKGIQC